MKSKPNTDQFILKKDPVEFLEGGAADASDRLDKKKNKNSAPVIEAKVHREQKVFRLPLDLINTLKREAYERSVETGSRVTETELVEKSLRLFFDK
ncbi:MAG: hypothetical protein PHQ58_21260 [Rhodoferax sp.]|uniref:hypothetical protein n=1 Tax=Rhodoferax sp. TaxID=50421 RepID=UPI00260D0525|nr:hypothetical protein [Rhodoferax sp.]MDD2882948.1 hypothetical protein [Rhodoferax sp.]